MRALLVLMLGLSVQAGEFNKVLSVGDAAPVWKNLEGTDDKKHSLDDYKGKEIVIVVFTCNSCAVSEGYEDRLIAFAEKYKNKAVVVAINPNTIKDDSLEKMKERAKKKKYNFDYLSDPTQESAKAYGAVYTPEFFVLNKDRKIAYLGAMDDKNKAGDAKEHFLEQAVEALLAGKEPSKTETLGRGCRIRYVKAK